MSRTYRELLAAVRVVPEEPPSHCGCPLPTGCWGSDGWHQTRHGRESLERLYMGYFAKEHDGKERRIIRMLWDNWRKAEETAGRFEGGLHESWKPYLGLTYCYEPCQAYRASVARGLNQEKTKKMAETPYA